MIPNPVSNQEKWKKALLQAVLGLFVVGFLTFVIFMFEPPNWLTGLLCLGNILWFSALPIMLIALLANAPFPDKTQAAQTKEPTKFEDLLSEEYWPVEWQESPKENKAPITSAVDDNTPTWMIFLLILIIFMMVALALIMLSIAS